MDLFDELGLWFACGFAATAFIVALTRANPEPGSFSGLMARLFGTRQYPEPKPKPKQKKLGPNIRY